MAELVRRERDRVGGAVTVSQARRDVAARLGVSVDWIDNRAVLSARLAEDSEVANRLASLRVRARNGRIEPLGLASLRIIIRVRPRRRLLKVLDALDVLPASGLTYSTVRRVVGQATGNGQTPEAGRIGGQPNATAEADQLSLLLSINEAAPGLSAALQRLGADLPAEGLQLAAWWRLLSRDFAGLNKRLEKILNGRLPGRQ